jgi:NADH-quinone oxidoreductase subunit M
MQEYSTYGFPILSAIIFLPLMGVLLVAFVDKAEDKLIKAIGFAIMLADFFISIPLWVAFDAGNPHIQFVERIPWMPSLGISYHLGIDGISLLLIMLTTFLGPVVMLSIWHAIDKRVKEFVISMLLMQTAMIGTFSAINLFLFYIFWELMLVPMYLIIGVWGGPRRIYAAIKFFVYTMVGSLLMLVAIFYIYRLSVEQFGKPTLDIFSLYNLKIPEGARFLGIGVQHLLFLAFALSFAIKVPMFPFHTWLPDAHVEAPTAGSVVLAAVLLKMGTYGFIRLAIPLFPGAAMDFTPLIVVLAVIGIVYGALVSMVQPDLKKLVAFSSVSHLGFVMLGMVAYNAMGVSGSVLQMVNHGLSTGALFLIVGFIYERRHTRLISDFGGIAKVMPVFAAFFMIVTLSSVGLPGTNGFIGEFLVLLGAYSAAFSKTLMAGGTHVFGGAVILVILATSGVVFAAVYMLWMFQRVMFGKVTKEENRHLKDLSLREVFVLLPIVVVIFVIGVYPNPFLRKLSLSVDQFNARMRAQRKTILVMTVERPKPPVELANVLAPPAPAKGAGSSEGAGGSAHAAH